MKKQQVAFQRMPAFMAELGYQQGSSSSKVYQQIHEGLLPPPVKLFGKRASVFLVHETKAIISARALGMPDEEIKELVNSFVRQRQEILDPFLELTPEEGNPIAKECRRSLDRLEHCRREYRFSMLPESSDALDDAADKLQIAVDIIESETSCAD